MSYSKHKDCLPEETLLKIKEVLNPLDISLNHIINKRLDGVYSSIVYDSKNWWSTGGKGTTEAYCLASGYAEAVEHLCNYCAYNYKAVNSNAESFGGFKRYPDEKFVSVREAILNNKSIFEDVSKCFSNDGSKFDIDECEQCWSLLFKNKGTTVVPFFSVRSNDVVYLPDEVVGRLSGSTGGGAGNTPYEALSHAFDEICERYVKHKIYFEKLTPPTIPREYIKTNCNDLHKLIQQIEQRGYTVIVKDASLGEFFPVVSVAIINPKNQSYMVKFGAHCCFNIALERCLTEMFQYFSLDTQKGNGHKTFHIWSEEDDIVSSLEGNWYTQLKDDTGAVPHTFFLNEASWEFNPWGVNISYSNKTGVLFHINNFKRLGCKDIFIRDLSFLGFPVFKVYIPHYSFSHLSINKDVIDSFLVATDVIRKIKKGQINDVSEYFDILTYCFSKDSYIGGMILKNVEEQIIEICHAALLYDRDKDLAQLKKLSTSNKYARAVLKDYELKDMGYSNEDRAELFTVFANEKLCAIVRSWSEKNTFVELIRCFDRCNETEGDSIKWEKYDLQGVSETHIRFKKRMIKNMPNQSEVLFIVNECYQ